MKKSIITTIIVLLICSNLSAKDNYKILTFEKDDVSLKFSKYYFVHYMYFDVLLALNINNELNLEDKKIILKDVYTQLLAGYQKQISITSIKPENLIFRLKPFKCVNQMSIIMYTNYDIMKKEIVSIDSKGDNFYAKQYYIINNKLVPSKIYYENDKSNATILQLKKENKYNSLADYLLYDPNSSNDSDIPKIIKEGLNSNPTLHKKIIMEFTLLEYYMSVKSNDEYNNVYKSIISDIKKIKANKESTYFNRLLNIFNEIKSIIEYI